MTKSIALVSVIEHTQRVFCGKIKTKQLREILQLPANAEIFLLVPSGGDYSGCKLVVGEDVEIQVTWKETESK